MVPRVRAIADQARESGSALLCAVAAEGGQEVLVKLEPHGVDRVERRRLEPSGVAD